ncbi:FAD-dependent oxidoreductase [Candidatus Microgenomates bacterium]|jgi:protoporphyrinogen oxidase|nr:MAG: FAD-dependent oxidoreductase [Candidatus Microgenomates bacterium]
MKIAVVGGGITGLASAYLLSRKGHEVYIFEKEKTLGGLASFFKENAWQWSLEKFYHHFFTSDQELFDLCKSLRIQDKLFFKNPKTSVLVDGKIYRFDNPQSILSFPKLSIIDKLRTGLTVLGLKLNNNWKPLEKIPAYSFIKKTMGKNTYNLIWKPLLESKFGKDFLDIPASWFWTRVKKRSFSLGYFEGGTQTLVSNLEKNILKNKGQILLNSEVKTIKKIGKKFELQAEKKYLFDKVIVTVPPCHFSKMSEDLSQEEKAYLSSLKSLGSLCLIISLDRHLLNDGTYWLNVNDSSYPFVAVVEHTNYIEKEKYGNEILVYIGGYYSLDNPIFSLTKDKVLQKFTPFLKKINPNIKIKKSWLFKEEYAQPVVSLNYSYRLPKITTSVSGLYWASLHHVYPEDRGINYAIKIAEKIADEVKKER